MATLAAPHLTASAPPSGLLASLTPSAKFGRFPENTGDFHADVLARRLAGNPAVAQAGYRPRAVSVLVDDPAAAALSLCTHMEPADLMELTLILAEAAAEVLRASRAIQDHQPPHRCP